MIPFAELPEEPNHDKPLECWVAKEVLEAIMEGNMTNVRANADVLDSDATDRAETKQILDRYTRFLAWVQEHPGPNGFIRLYPADVLEEVDEVGDF
jgi:hypothetical protein